MLVKTEPQYFTILQNLQPTVAVDFINSHDSSPLQVLKRLKDYLEQEQLIPPYEAWIVVDKDEWNDEQLTPLHNWAQERNNYGFALSNPKFEYWLLLHFEDGNSIKSLKDCDKRLKKKEHLPNYDKGITANQITRERIEDAIRRARQRDNPPCADWPRELGGTTVYKLAEKILQGYSPAPEGA